MPFGQITARLASLIIRKLCDTSARGEAKLVSPRDLVKRKCLTISDLRLSYSRGEFQKFHCPVECPYCISVRIEHTHIPIAEGEVYLCLALRASLISVQLLWKYWWRRFVQEKALWCTNRVKNSIPYRREAPGVRPEWMFATVCWSFTMFVITLWNV